LGRPLFLWVKGQLSLKGPVRPGGNISEPIGAVLQFQICVTDNGVAIENGAGFVTCDVCSRTTHPPALGFLMFFEEVMWFNANGHSLEWLHFFKPMSMRALEEIKADLRTIQAEGKSCLRKLAETSKITCWKPPFH